MATGSFFFLFPYRPRDAVSLLFYLPPFTTISAPPLSNQFHLHFLSPFLPFSFFFPFPSCPRDAVSFPFHFPPSTTISTPPSSDQFCLHFLSSFFPFSFFFLFPTRPRVEVCVLGWARVVPFWPIFIEKTQKIIFFCQGLKMCCVALCCLILMNLPHKTQRKIRVNRGCTNFNCISFI